ncbi:putative Corazonin preprohormone [Daphnia magna]|uniref:Pro-corazonin n=2 Tax=Daphnia magna TaxID=35525 RepID=A0A162T2V9_9CRUS|nr:putative Corazonin preprohormone [Daphnia magna]
MAADFLLNTLRWTRYITWWSVGIRYASSAMAIRLYFVLLLIVVSSMAQTFQYSRGWTNGRKRADPSFIQQQLLQHGRPILPVEFQTSNSVEDWNRYKINNENKLNEDGDWLVHVNHCAKLATSLGSLLKNKDGKLSDEPIVNVIR